MNIRGHHLVCIPRFRGRSYDKKFKENFFNIQKRIRKNPNIKIRITRSCDEICQICPFKKGNKCTKKKSSNYWVKVQDNKVIKKLGVKENESWQAKDIFNLSVKKIKNKELKEICGECEFLKFCLEYGLNKSFTESLGVGRDER